MTQQLPGPAAFASAEFAVRFCTAMRAARKHQTLIAQSLNIVGETGEMVEALRRYIGFARRASTLAEVAGELADVEISSHIYLELAGAPWRDAFQQALSVADVAVGAATEVSPPVAALLVDASAGKFATEAAEAHHFGVLRGIPDAPIATSAVWTLASVVHWNRNLAVLLGVDLPAAVQAKSDVIMSRGFGVQRSIDAVG